MPRAAINGLFGAAAGRGRAPVRAGTFAAAARVDTRAALAIATPRISPHVSDWNPRSP